MLIVSLNLSIERRLPSSIPWFLPDGVPLRMCLLSCSWREDRVSGHFYKHALSCDMIIYLKTASVSTAEVYRRRF
jgi:hypothetical protein